MTVKMLATQPEGAPKALRPSTRRVLTWTAAVVVLIFEVTLLFQDSRSSWVAPGLVVQ
jgi:hypothetical protein